MRIYLAARLGRWPEMNVRAHELARVGHEITSRWHATGFKPPHPPDRSQRSGDLAAVAQQDLDDIARAEAVVLFTEYGRHFAGGRHVEAGFALALGKRLYVAGPRENVFYHLPQVVQTTSWPMLIRLLEQPHE